MVHFVRCLTSLLFFDILLLYYIILYYYINFRSSIIVCLCSGEIYLFLHISLSIPILSFLFVTELLCDEVFETFVILSAILLPIKSPVTSVF